MPEEDGRVYRLPELPGLVTVDGRVPVFVGRVAGLVVVVGRVTDDGRDTEDGRVTLDGRVVDDGRVVVPLGRVIEPGRVTVLPGRVLVLGRTMPLVLLGRVGRFVTPGRVVLPLAGRFGRKPPVTPPPLFGRKPVIGRLPFG